MVDVGLRFVVLRPFSFGILHRPLLTETAIHLGSRNVVGRRFDYVVAVSIWLPAAEREVIFHLALSFPFRTVNVPLQPTSFIT